MNYYGNDVNNYVLAKCSGNDYLMHKSHKYLRKVFVNGKWRYYYGKIGNSKRSKLLEKISDWSGEDEKERLRRAKENRDNFYKEYDKIAINSIKSGDDKFNEDKSKLYRKYGISNIESPNKLYYEKQDTQRAYRETPLYKLEQTSEKFKKSIDKGKEFISNLFSKKEIGE